jgi:hypothetical protein
VQQRAHTRGRQPLPLPADEQKRIALFAVQSFQQLNSGIEMLCPMTAA